MDIHSGNYSWSKICSRMYKNAPFRRIKYKKFSPSPTPTGEDLTPVGAFGTRNPPNTFMATGLSSMANYLPVNTELRITTIQEKLHWPCHNFYFTPKFVTIQWKKKHPFYKWPFCLSPWPSWLTPQCTLPVLAARRHRVRSLVAAGLQIKVPD